MENGYENMQLTPHFAFFRPMVLYLEYTILNDYVTAVKTL